MISDTLAFLVEYLDLPRAVGDPDATWEIFQLSHLNNQSILSIDVKSRQAAWSWTAAAESLARSILYPKSLSAFVSINRKESYQKIRYVKQINDALDADVRQRFVVDNSGGLEISNGSRIESEPCKPYRGPSKPFLYLDEFAHYPNDGEVYQSVLPAISKGGFLRIGSSPLGARGKFWEIYTENMRSYSGYARGYIPWWTIGSFCNNVSEAAKLAPHMETDERVKLFGTSRLRLMYDNMPISDFQQEYECAWLDDTISWIDWDLIRRNQDLAASDKLTYWKVSGEDDAMHSIEEMRQAVARADIEQVFFGGLDVGRYKDTTEIVLVGESEQYNQLPYRLGVTLARTDFDTQQRVIDKVMSTLPVSKMLIDKNGIGTQLAETSEKRFPDRAVGVVYSNGSKELWAVEAKVRAQRGQVPIPIERDFMYQIHSIKKKPTPTGKASFDTDSDTKGHHADMFWAWATAVYAGKTAGVAELESGDSVTAGYRG